MIIETENSKENAVTVKLVGDLVAVRLPVVRVKIRELVDSGQRKITLDMSNVTMMDSAGLGLLISAHNSLRAVGGQLAVINASKDLMNLFHSMRVHQHFSISGC